MRAPAEVRMQACCSQVRQEIPVVVAPSSCQLLPLAPSPFVANGIPVLPTTRIAAVPEGIYTSSRRSFQHSTSRPECATAGVVTHFYLAGGCSGLVDRSASQSDSWAASGRRWQIPTVGTTCVQSTYAYPHQLHSPTPAGHKIGPMLTPTAGRAQPQRTTVPVAVEVVSGTRGQTNEAIAQCTVLSGQATRYVPPSCPNPVPTDAGIQHIDPMTVQGLMKEKKCILIDLRGSDRVAGLIEGALHVPCVDEVNGLPFLKRVPDLIQEWADEELVIFTCQYSAHRAPQCANWYREKARCSQNVAILSGGFRGWEQMGLPVQNPATPSQAQQANAKAIELGNQALSL